MEKVRVLNKVGGVRLRKVWENTLFCQNLKHSTSNFPLYSRFHYILILLVAIVVYLIYLIGYYKVQEYGTDAFMESIRVAGKNAEDRIASKEFLAAYIRTRAYETQVAKATQNKKLPGEEVINIVTEEEVSSNADIDTRTTIAGIQAVAEDPTKGMDNPRKWWWMIEEGIHANM